MRMPSGVFLHGIAIALIDLPDSQSIWKSTRLCCLEAKDALRKFGCLEILFKWLVKAPSP
jgi:hypothetical protein